MSEMNPR